MDNRDGLLCKARKSKNIDDWKNYKTMKNRTNNSINRAKQSIIKNYCLKISQSLRSFGSIFKHFFQPNQSVHTRRVSLLTIIKQLMKVRLQTAFARFSIQPKISQSKLYKIKTLCMVTSEKTSDQCCTSV